MKKIVFILSLCSQFCIGNNIEPAKDLKHSEKDKADPVSCCTRRSSSGIYGQAGYNQVSVTRCVTSTISYQEAYSNACSLAWASVQQALTIAESTNGPVQIGSGR